MDKQLEKTIEGMVSAILDKINRLEKVVMETEDRRQRVNKEIDTLCLEGMRMSGDASVIAKFQRIAFLAKLPLEDAGKVFSDNHLQPL